MENLRSIIGDKFIDEYLVFKKEMSDEHWVIYEKEIGKVIAKTAQTLDNINMKFMSCIHIDETKEKQIHEQQEVADIMNTFMPLMILYQIMKK